jgi:hypothetical protein
MPEATKTAPDGGDCTQIALRLEAVRNEFLSIGVKGKRANDEKIEALIHMDRLIDLYRD